MTDWLQLKFKKKQDEEVHLQDFFVKRGNFKKFYF